MKNSKLDYLVWVMMCFVPSMMQAATFNIVPQRTLPTTVPEHGASFAYYVVSNLTGMALNNNFVHTLPADVTQVTCQPQFCGATFNLAPFGAANDNCILKLTIKGPVNSPNPLHVCTEDHVTCEGTATPLDVTQVPSLPFIGMGAGLYLNSSGQRFPLLATTQDSGASWYYPPAIFSDVSASIGPSFVSGSLFNAACTGENDKVICIAPGQYLTNETILPLIAVGTDNATSWNYPHSIFENLQHDIAPNFIGGELDGASCSGSGEKSICIAAGNYFTNDTQQLPLIAQSSDGGRLWTYPKSIHQHLETQIDPSFIEGFLKNASCSKSTCETVCIASGGYCNVSQCKPLLAISKNKGSSWTYPPEIFQNLTTKVDPNFGGGSFESSSCVGSGNETICTAAGAFFNNSTILPLLALTQNGGSSWSYPPSIFSDLPTRIGREFIGGLFNSTSCAGSGRTTVCIAAGTFFRDGPNYPFIAVSRDAGSTWTYPDFIYTKLKVVVDPKFVSGIFLGTSCTGKGRKAICVAAGGYCRDSGCSSENPLIALSTNGGKSWTYPPSVYTDLMTKIDPKFQLGFFRDISCTGDENYSFCMAAGQYSNDVTTFPLIALSNDSGQTWTYPTDIFNGLNVKIDPNFAIGVFNSAASTGGKFPLTTKERARS